MEKAPTHHEEFVNAVTHGLGVVLSIGGGAVLIALAALHAGGREIVAVSIYSASLVLLYTTSTLYHAARRPATKSRLKIVDHCAIFLLIAGTYTPFTIAAIRGGWGWSLFGIVWGLAVIGVVLKLFFTGRFRVLSTAIYIGMGWLALIAIVPMTRALTPTALTWLVVGGVIYTAGTAFYHNHRIPHAHGIWHLFVLGGSISHYIAVTAQVLA